MTPCADNLGPEAQYAGMTVNERLAAASLLERFDAAARGRDRGAMVSILREAGLTEVQAAWTAGTILERPAKYGY